MGDEFTFSTKVKENFTEHLWNNPNARRLLSSDQAQVIGWLEISFKAPPPPNRNENPAVGIMSGKPSSWTPTLELSLRF